MTRDEEMQGVWDRASEGVHQIRLGVSNVVAQSPYPKLISAQAMALVLVSMGEGLRIAAEGSDGQDPISPSSLDGFEAIPDLVTALRMAADVFHEVHEKGKS
jgi:hypothetical protein